MSPEGNRKSAISSICNSVRSGAKWFKMVRQKAPAKASEVQRFSVSLPKQQYDRLKAIADAFEPPLTLQYMLEYAVKLLLDRAAAEKKLVIEAVISKQGPKS